MKKIRFVQAVGVVLFLGYILLLVIDVFKGFLGNYYQLILSLIMAIIGFNLLFKAVIIKSSSTIWFAIVLISMSVVIITMSLYRIEIEKLYYVFAIIPLFASLLNLIVFNNLIYIKVMIINATIIVPMIIQQFYTLGNYWSIGLFVISILIGIIICRVINFDKEKV